MSFRERGVAATTLDPNEKTFRVPFEGAGGLSFYLRHLPATTKGSTRKAVLYAHGARLASAVTIAHRFDGLSWRDDLAADGWDVWGLDYVGYGGADRYAAMLEPPEANPPLCRAEEKANGQLRPLGISTVRDRVCMTAAMLVLKPIFTSHRKSMPTVRDETPSRQSKRWGSWCSVAIRTS